MFLLSLQESPLGFSQEIAGWSLIVPLAMVLSLWIIIRSRPPEPHLNSRLGPVNWDITKSFSSSLTAVSAILGTVIASQSSIIPKPPQHAPVPVYTSMNLFFAALVVVAPFLYSTVRKNVSVNPKPGVAEPQYQGFVGMFLLSSVVTLWATTGALTTMWFLIGELPGEGSISSLLASVFQFVAVVALLSVFCYSLTSIYWIIGFQTRQDGTEAKPRGAATPGEHPPPLALALGGRRVGEAA
jgi:hypothetical protein